MPLYALKKNNVKFNWSDACNKAFDLLKKNLTEYSVLRPANFKLKFVLLTLHAYAIGAILMQIDGELVCYSSLAVADATFLFV